MQTKGIYVIGTDTDVGKTYVSALLMEALLNEGIRATYFKAALSGAEERDGEMWLGDAEYVRQISGLEEEAKNTVAYGFKCPVSPHLAARLEGVNVSMTHILACHEGLKEKYDFIVAEGSGGIICPLKLEEEEIFLEDVVKHLGYPVVLIAKAGVGTINHTYLTVHYLKCQGINLKGIILNGYEEEHVAHEDNARVIQQLTGVPIMGYVPYEKGMNKGSIIFNEGAGYTLSSLYK